MNKRMFNSLADAFNLYIASSSDPATTTATEVVAARMDFMAGAAAAMQLLSRAENAADMYNSIQGELLVHAKDRLDMMQKETPHYSKLNS